MAISNGESVFLVSRNGLVLVSSSEVSLHKPKPSRGVLTELNGSTRNGTFTNLTFEFTL